MHRSARKGAFKLDVYDGCFKLQRSRAPECTERGKTITLHNAAVTLQRSRAPECTESGRSRGRGRATQSGFNGAVHRSARKGSRWGGRRSTRATLQRSRAPECTDSKISDHHPRPITKASTEPCTGVHGKRGHFLRSWRGDWCFNGAVHRSARKAPPTLPAVSVGQASTEPCTGVHGKGVLARLTGGVKAELQRSRAPECTERGQHPRLAEAFFELLQRSRAPECTERAIL